MPVEKTASVREIKDSIKLNNKKTGAKLSFSQVQAMVREALESEAQQDFALIQCYFEIIKSITDSYLTKRAMANSNEVLYEKYNKYASQNYNIVSITDEVIGWVEAIGMQIDETYMKKHPMTEVQLRAIRDFQLASIRSASYYGELKNCLKSWGRDCYYKEIERIDGIFNDPDDRGPKHVFGGDMHNKKDIAASEIYQKTVLVREELATYNGFWKLVYFRYVKACNAFLEHADNTLREIGFNPTQHADKATEILKETVMPPNDEDRMLIVDTYLAKVRTIKNIKNGVSSRAYDKLAKAQALECKHETSFEKILSEYNKKYDTELTAVLLGYSEAEIMVAADSYDKNKYVAPINNAIDKAFTVAIEKIYVSAMKNGTQINAAEVLADARKIAVLAAQRFTPYFEIEENAELEYPMYLKDKNEEYFKNKIDEFANKARLMISMEEDSLRKKGQPIPDNLSRSKDELTKEKLDTLKKDITSASAQLMSDMAKLVKEDKELALSLGSKLPKPKKPQIDSNAYKPKPIDQPTEKHLEAWKKFLDIGYRPSLNKDLKMQYFEFNDMKVTLIDGNNNIPKDVRRVVELTRSKFINATRAMKNAKEKNIPFSEGDMNAMCQKLENDAQKLIPNYQPKDPLELLKLRNQQRIEQDSAKEEAKASEQAKQIAENMDEKQIEDLCKQIVESSKAVIDSETEKFFKENVHLSEKDFAGYEGEKSKSPKTDEAKKEASTKMFAKN